MWVKRAGSAAGALFLHSTSNVATTVTWFFSKLPVLNRWRKRTLSVRCGLEHKNKSRPSYEGRVFVLNAFFGAHDPNPARRCPSYAGIEPVSLTVFVKVSAK